MTSPGVVNYAAEKHSVELRDMPRPDVGPEDVLLEVAAVGVCGSDLHQWTGDQGWVVNNSTIKSGDRVMVLGPGPIGLLCAAVAKLQGAEVAVVGLQRDSSRLAIAQQYGCTAIAGDPKEWAMAGDGYGVDGVVDAAGVSATLKIALEVVRPAGWITKVGWRTQPMDFSLDPLVQKNITLQGSYSHNWPVWERVLALLASGDLDVAPITGGVWPLEDWNEAFETMHSGAIAKAVLQP